MHMNIFPMHIVFRYEPSKCITDVSFFLLQDSSWRDKHQISLVFYDSTRYLVSLNNTDLGVVWPV